MIVSMTIFLFPMMSFAHPGRTDSSGCHTCRTNCSSWGLSTGDYHCHNAKAVPQPEAPIKSHYGENGTGYTEPAPEYEYDSSSSEGSISTKNHISNPSEYSNTSNKNESSDDDWLGTIIAIAIAGGMGYWIAKR